VSRRLKESHHQLHASQTSMCRFSILSAGSLGLKLFKMYRARRRACRIRLLRTPKTFGEGRSSDKEAQIEFPSITCDSDLKHVSPYYQQGA